MKPETKKSEEKKRKRRTISVNTVSICIELLREHIKTMHTEIDEEKEIKFECKDLMKNALVCTFINYVDNLKYAIEREDAEIKGHNNLD